MKRLAVLLAGGSLAIVACTDVITTPGVPVAIEIGPLPYPSVVLGDSLRDSTGAAVPVPVRVFDGRGEQIENPDVTFLVLGSQPPAIVNATTGHLVAAREGEARVVAGAGPLQTAPLVIPLVYRPTVLEAVSDLRDTIEYREFLDHESEIRVRLMADTGQAPLAPVRAYLVDFRIVDPPGLPANDSTFALLVNEQHRPSTRDTTAADGVAARRLRLSPWILRPPPDSVVVEVGARHLDGTLVAGSPLTFVIVVEPQP